MCGRDFDQHQSFSRSLIHTPAPVFCASLGLVPVPKTVYHTSQRRTVLMCRCSAVGKVRSQASEEDGISELL